MRNMRQKVRFIDFFKPFARKNASFAHPSYNNKRGGRSLCCRPYVRVLPPVRARFAALARRFAERLRQKTQIEIVFEDERFTTMEAERVLISGGVRRENRKRTIDSIAASYILEGYLNKINK